MTSMFIHLTPAENRLNASPSTRYAVYHDGHFHATITCRSSLEQMRQHFPRCMGYAVEYERNWYHAAIPNHQ